MNKAQWLITPPRPEAERLASELGLPLAIARVLVNRGISTAGEAQTFLHGSLENLPDPFLMKGMDRAVARIQAAAERKEKVLVFGDYDVDGVLSVVILLRALRALGIDADYFIPERLKEGYGIKDEHLAVVKERGAKLVISVDCGIKAESFALKAKAEGVDVIITDHHRPGDSLPAAEAILNPVLGDSGYPYRNLAGVGVVFKLLQALLTREGKAAGLPHYAKLVAIGTIADVAELRGENRLLVKLGLSGLGAVVNRGLRSLIEECGSAAERSPRVMSGSGSLPASTPPAGWAPPTRRSGSFSPTPSRNLPSWRGCSASSTPSGRARRTGSSARPFSGSRTALLTAATRYWSWAARRGIGA